MLRCFFTPPTEFFPFLALGGMVVARIRNPCVRVRVLGFGVRVRVIVRVSIRVRLRVLRFGVRVRVWCWS